MLKSAVKNLRDIYMRSVWGVDLRQMAWARRSAVKALRIAHNLVIEIAEGNLTLRAMSLVYTTLLSLVPLLAVSFSMLKAFGVHNQIEPLLFNFLAPLGEKGVEFTERIIDFVDNVKVGVLGSLGLAMLIYTVVSLVQKIEAAFNFIWHINQPRRFVRRFSDYMSVILIGPVLVVSALGITATVMGSDVMQSIVAVEPIGSLVNFVTRLLPYILMCSAFTFIYIFIPNTKVKFVSALTGGIVAGSLWQTGGWFFAAFVATSTKYTAIYSGFAIIVIFMIWLYLSWLIVLLGAQIAYYHQHPSLLRARHGSGRLSNEGRERLAIMLMMMIGYNYYYNRGPWTVDNLMRELAVPPQGLQYVLGLLERHGFINRSNDEPPGYYPARDIETISLRQVLEVTRHADDSIYDSLKSRPEGQQVESVMKRLDAAIGDALADQTIKELVLAQTRPDDKKA